MGEGEGMVGAGMILIWFCFKNWPIGNNFLRKMLLYCIEGEDEEEDVEVEEGSSIIII